MITAETMANMVVARELVKEASRRVMVKRALGTATAGLIGAGLGGLGGAGLGYLTGDETDPKAMKRKMIMHALMGAGAGGVAGGLAGYTGKSDAAIDTLRKAYDRSVSWTDSRLANLRKAMSHPGAAIKRIAGSAYEDPGRGLNLWQQLGILGGSPIAGRALAYFGDATPQDFLRKSITSPFGGRESAIVDTLKDLGDKLGPAKAKAIMDAIAAKRDRLQYPNKALGMPGIISDTWRRLYRSKGTPKPRAVTSNIPIDAATLHEAYKRYMTGPRSVEGAGGKGWSILPKGKAGRGARIGGALGIAGTAADIIARYLEKSKAPIQPSGE